MALLRSSNKTQNSTDPQQQPSETLSESPSQQIKDFFEGEAKDFIENEAALVAIEYGSMLSKLSPLQQEYVNKIAIIKAAETSELTFDEILALGDILNECQRMQIEITSELSSFWTKIGDLTKEAGAKAGKFGFKLAAKAIVGYLPIPM